MLTTAARDFDNHHRVAYNGNGNIDTSTATAPVQAFVLTNAGLMAGVSLEGTKVTRLKI